MGILGKILVGVGIAGAAIGAVFAVEAVEKAKDNDTEHTVKERVEEKAVNATTKIVEWVINKSQDGSLQAIGDVLTCIVVPMISIFVGVHQLRAEGRIEKKLDDISKNTYDYGYDKGWTDQFDKVKNDLDRASKEKIPFAMYNTQSDMDTMTNALGRYKVEAV